MAKKSLCAKLKNNRMLISHILNFTSWNKPHYFEYCREKPIKQRVTSRTAQRKTLPPNSSEFSLDIAPFALNPKAIVSTCSSAFKVYVIPPDAEISTLWDDFHLTKNFIANIIAEGESVCVVNGAMDGFCIQFKAKFSPPEKDIIAWTQGKKKRSKAAITLMKQYKDSIQAKLGNPLYPFLIDVAESICSVDLNTRTKQLYPSKPKGD